MHFSGSSFVASNPQFKLLYFSHYSTQFTVHFLICLSNESLVTSLDCNIMQQLRATYTNAVLWRQNAPEKEFRSRMQKIVVQPRESRALLPFRSKNNEQSKNSDRWGKINMIIWVSPFVSLAALFQGHLPFLLHHRGGKTPRVERVFRLRKLWRARPHVQHASLSLGPGEKWGLSVGHGKSHQNFVSARRLSDDANTFEWLSRSTGREAGVCWAQHHLSRRSTFSTNICSLNANALNLHKPVRNLTRRYNDNSICGVLNRPENTLIVDSALSCSWEPENRVTIQDDCFLTFVNNHFATCSIN